MILAAWGVDIAPGMSIWLPVLILVLPQLSRWANRRLSRTETSQNVLAYISPELPGADSLLLCAHVDSARAIALRHPVWLRLYHRTLDIVQRVVFLIVGLAIIRQLGIVLPLPLYWLGSIAGTLAGGWLAFGSAYNQLAHGNRYSPGAVDNASGVGVLLALSEAYAQHPPHRLRLGFLFTGAEETGLHGARSFAEQQRENANNMKVLCLDMVGAGDTMRYVNRDGMLFPYRTDEYLNRLICQAHPTARPLWYTHKSSDVAAFLWAGIPAASLEISGSARAEQAYHTVNDTIDKVDQSALEMTVQTVTDVIRQMDSEAEAS